MQLFARDLSHFEPKMVSEADILFHGFGIEQWAFGLF
jgi:hypothetical protein